MSYIKDLYEKKPELVKGAIRRLFNIKRDENFVLLTNIDGVLINFIDKENGEFKDIVLEDFAICYGLEYIEMSDRRLQEYLKFMARVYGNKYLQGFHNYRMEERKKLISEFNTLTYAMEGELAKAISCIENKKRNNVSL